MNLTTFLLAIAAFSIVVVGFSMLLELAASKLQDYGEVNIDINDGEKVLKTESGGTLLSILGANKIFIPSACGGQGTCAYCKLQVLEGGGPVLPTETGYLSRQEKRDNVRLSCQVKVKNDLKLKVPEDYLEVKEYKANIVHVKQLTYDIYEVRMKLQDDEKLDFRASQYIQVKAPDPKTGGHVYRAYSLSNPETENGFAELIVRHIPGGICSTYLCKTVEEGEEIIFNGPFGEFDITEDPDTEIICVGGGSGMAPMKSIILSFLERQPERHVSFYFGCRAVKDIFYYDMFEELAKKYPNFRFTYALSQLDEGDEWEGPTGFVHLAVDEQVDDEGKKVAFLCGPPMMVNAVTTVLRYKSMRKREIFYDDFGI